LLLAVAVVVLPVQAAVLVAVVLVVIVNFPLSLYSLAQLTQSR
jgi:hypothetical protein